MRTLIAVGLGAGLVGASLRAGEAQVYVRCLAPRFEPATTRVLGQDYSFALTSLSSTEPANGELALLGPGAPTSHGGYAFYAIPNLDEPIFGALLLDLAPFEDANTNGLNDFFEVDMATLGSSKGTFDDGLLGEGDVAAVWNRAAGSAVGTCRLTLKNQGITFAHRYQILEYRGRLRYDIAGTNVTGAIDAAQFQAESNRLAGSLTLTRIDADHLALGAGVWTNRAGQALPFAGDPAVERLATQYPALVFFDDGDPASPAPDYRPWILVIADGNDANGNGIPDLSDPAASPPPATLAIEVSAGELVLRVTAFMGASYQLRRSASLTTPAWQTVRTLALTNAVQSFSLGPALDAAGYWQLLR